MEKGWGWTEERSHSKSGVGSDQCTGEKEVPQGRGRTPEKVSKE